MTFIQDETTAIKAMESISESIATFKRFVEALDRFLKANKIGSARWDETGESEFGEHGYDIAMFHLESPFGADIMYLYIYTDGTVSGENFSIEGPQSGINECGWEDAIQEILKTVGVRRFPPLSREKIDKAIEALGG